MGLVAVIAALTAAALGNARDQSIASDAAEQLLTAIREAQNRSISVTKGKNAGVNDTKVWGVKIGANVFSLVYFDATPDTSSVLTMQTQEAPSLYPGTTLTSVYHSSSGTTTTDTNRYFTYSAPFGKPYSLTSACPGSGGACTWIEDTTPTKEWKPSGVYGGWASETDYVEITISYKGQSHKIKINPKNEAFIE